MSVVQPPLRIFRSARAQLAEGPVWDPSGELVWVSISERRVHRSPLDGAESGADDLVFETPSAVGFALPARHGGLVLGLEDGVYASESDGSDLRRIVEIEHEAPDMRLNDAAVDPHGRLLAGSIVPSGAGPTAKYYSIDADGDARVLKSGFGNANGIGWSPDGSRVYFTDTRQDTIFTADYTDSGDLENERVFARVGHHDGLTVDAEGFVWGAIYGEGAVVRLNPDGDVVARIDVPTPNTTSVAFGGVDMSTLFITTAAQGRDLDADPLAGSVFALDTEVEGLPVNVFGATVPLAPRP